MVLSDHTLYIFKAENDPEPALVIFPFFILFPHPCLYPYFLDDFLNVFFFNISNVIKNNIF